MTIDRKRIAAVAALELQGCVWHQGEWLPPTDARTYSDHPCSALTGVVVSSVEAARMLSVEFPRLGAAILWATSRDEHLVSIGRRSAVERTAHFFLELHARLRLVGLASDTEFSCPLNQYVLADALGLSAIHVNRVLRQLRELKLLTLRQRKVIMQDLSGLKALAGYQACDWA